ncbi:hypothetical protein [Variovorax boronicumulans]|uniref:hypothetical protein n=1 Tax=Variovorax boronicumulans TaxID=436515 RepID=UPI0033996319
MTMTLLKQIAGSRLPASYYRNEDIDAVRVLRAAGLVVALVPSRTNDAPCRSDAWPAAQVLAITQKGREELARFDYPQPLPRPPRWRFRMPKIKTAGFGPFGAGSASSASSSASRETARPQ